jgi:hypothetical protein
MTDNSTVVLPPTGTSPLRRTANPLFLLPLLAVPWVIYNILGITLGQNPTFWTAPLFPIPTVSGTPWFVSWGDIILVIGLICLFLEVLKSTNTTRSSVLEHMLSTAVFIIFLIEFLLVGYCASSAFFLLMAMALFDVVAGFTVSITSAGRDVTMN